jgi:DNA-binding transcriptional LysR family regulator
MACTTLSQPETVLAGLDEDRIDLGIGIGPFTGAQTHHKRHRLLTDSYLCLFSPALTRLHGPLTLDDYLRLPDVLTSLRPGEHGTVDTVLAVQGLARTVVLTTPRFMSVPILVAQAPVVATMHARPARILAEAFGLRTSPPPITLPPVAIDMLWHASYDQNQAHLWLRCALILAALDIVGAAPAAV